MKGIGVKKAQGLGRSQKSKKTHLSSDSSDEDDEVEDEQVNSMHLSHALLICITGTITWLLVDICHA